MRSELASRIDAVERRLDSKIEVLKLEVRSGFTASVQRSKMRYFVARHPRPAKSRTSVSALRDWKGNAVSDHNS